MRTISLSRGEFCLVDDSDFEWLNQWKWTLHVSRDGNKSAKRTLWNGGKQKTIQMHRFILGASMGVEVDHRDLNGLNNQRHNLRKATRSQNASNVPRHKDAGSRFKGVTWDKARGKWMARLTVGKKFKNLGRFDSETEAAQQYDPAAVKAFGEFALTNQDLGLL